MIQGQEEITRKIKRKRHGAADEQKERMYMSFSASILFLKKIIILRLILYLNLHFAKNY